MNIIKATYLTQVPGPYRERMHTILSARKDLSYSVIYCAELEPNRNWELQYGDYKRYFLAKKSKTYTHNNPAVWKMLNKLNPDVLIITAFKPTMMYGVIWCLIKGKKIIVYNDGTLESEKDFSTIQKVLRRFVFKKAHAFVAPGKGTVDLYKSYGLKGERIFISCLCVENSRFVSPSIKDRKYDLLFCGQIIERKMPVFFVEVAKLVKKEVSDLNILIIGDGDLRESMLERLDDANIEYTFTGFLDQEGLPQNYAKAKLFLFPTLNDPWGIVVNEACASGMPVITTPVAGVADDLILNEDNGFILQPDKEEWARKVIQCLKDHQLLETMSNRSLELVKNYNHLAAANGISDSIRFVMI